MKYTPKIYSKINYIIVKIKNTSIFTKRNSQNYYKNQTSNREHNRLTVFLRPSGTPQWYKINQTPLFLSLPQANDRSPMASRITKLLNHQHRRALATAAEAATCHAPRGPGAASLSKVTQPTQLRELGLNPSSKPYAPLSCSTECRGCFKRRYNCLLLPEVLL
jgi:hypothetical protein